ncbi:MAG TPA: DUF5668 domain-containing protein [Thermoanaerobaculia bacterium]|nr:DUF5668 domain-containing protein [Thermoanaerobaculia bacterium]
MNSERRDSPWTRLAWGIVVLTAGLVFWLDRIDRIDAREYLEWWPLALIVIAIGHLPQRRWGAAAVWLAAGAFFLLPRFDILIRPWRLFNFWPLLISVAGVTLILQALRPRKPGLTFDTTAVMAGNTLMLGSQNLSGGNAVAVMGGVDIDFGAARTESGEVTVNVLAFWGGIDIRVPKGWRVENRVAEILGGVEDTTAPAAENAPRLILRGSAIMGGVGVTNSVEESA